MNNSIEKRRGKFVRLGKLRQSTGSGKIKEIKNDVSVDDLFITCSSCEQEFSKETIKSNLYVCPNCGHHYAMPPEKRISALMDEGSFKVFNFDFPEIDPLNFEGYVEKKEDLRARLHTGEAVLGGVGTIDGRKAVVVVMNSKFMMGSMGVEVGETVTRAVEHAYRHKLPLIIFCASGGARMQEGIVSLMQMAKTSAALERYKKKGGLYIVYYTHPTTGGVSASFAGLGDINLAEPKALVGFAGPKVIEQTIGQKLPEGFQRAEYLEEHGFVDQVVSRDKMRETLSQILMLHNIPTEKG